MRTYVWWCNRFFKGGGLCWCIFSIFCWEVLGVHIVRSVGDGLFRYVLREVILIVAYCIFLCVYLLGEFLVIWGSGPGFSCMSPHMRISMELFHM